MSAHRHSAVHGFLLSAFLSASFFLTPTPAACEEDSGPAVLRLSPPDMSSLKSANIYGSQARQGAGDRAGSWLENHLKIHGG
jgi:hypothetical protein